MRTICRGEVIASLRLAPGTGELKILLYNPDNGVTQNFMPHLWMFLLQALTPSGHEVILIDGNTQPMSDAELVQFALVGRDRPGRNRRHDPHDRQSLPRGGFASRCRHSGRHGRTARDGIPDEALGRNGGPRHADAVALGEADETWPRIVEDAARGELKEVYAPMDAFGQDRKPTLQDYPDIPWDSIDLQQFNRIPGFARPIMQPLGIPVGDVSYHSHRIGPRPSVWMRILHRDRFFRRFDPLPIEPERRQRDAEFKERARGTSGQAAVFFVDDNFAINVKRTKGLLRDIIAAGAELSWVGQISANLLRDEELLDLIAASGGEVDLHRDGVARSSQSGQRQQGFQQAGGI